MQAPTLTAALQSAIDQLALTQGNARLDAELLLAQALGQSRTYLRTWPERLLTDQQVVIFSALLARRVAGEPIAHILGRREFWSLNLEVTAATLIPRPETELLVELALQRIPLDTTFSILDLGTGSGAIALALAHERPRAQVLATDRSLAALEVAQRNALRLNLQQIVFQAASWYAGLDAQRFDMIVSNPPYIAAGDPHLTQGDVRFDPGSALISGADGLEDLRLIVAHAHQHLHPGGWLLVEHGYDQGVAVQALFSAAKLMDICGVNDLAGQPRVTLGRRSTAA